MFIFLTEHVSKLGHFFALFRTADKLFSHDAEAHYIILFDVAGEHLVNGPLQVDEQLVVCKTNPAELIWANWLHAHDLVLDQSPQTERLAARDAVNLVCVEHLEDQGRWLPVPTIHSFAHFALFLLHLQILVVQFHV